MDAIKEVVVDLGILRHAAQQLVDQLAHTETHCMTVGFMRLRRKDGRNSPNSFGKEVRQKFGGKMEGEEQT